MSKLSALLWRGKDLTNHVELQDLESLLVDVKAFQYLAVCAL